jgi:dethiobiotin synthetase
MTPTHRRPPTLFVTGTDTGVGKTTVSAALLAAWRRSGRRVAPLKPIETGCDGVPPDLVPADALRLAAAAGLADTPVDVLCPNRYALPASPEAASRAEGRPVDLDAIDRAHARLAAGADLVLVEGAGGLLVPIAPGVLMADLAARLGATLLLVARASLGTINHTLLTVEAARRRGLAVAGVILNRTASLPGPDEPTNAEAIARHGGVEVLGTLPHLPGEPADALATAATAHLDLDLLWERLQRPAP